MAETVEDILAQLKETEEETGFFTRVHVGRMLPRADGIGTPAEAHEYFDTLEDEGVVEELDRPSSRHALRYEIDSEYDLGTVAETYDPESVLGDDTYSH